MDLGSFRLIEGAEKVSSRSNARRFPAKVWVAFVACALFAFALAARLLTNIGAALEFLSSALT